MAINQNTTIIIGVVALVISLAVGVIIGHFTANKSLSSNDKQTIQYHTRLLEDLNSNGFDELVKNVNPEILKKNL